MESFEESKQSKKDFDSTFTHIISMTHVCLKTLNLYNNNNDVYTKEEFEDYSKLIRKLY